MEEILYSNFLVEPCTLETASRQIIPTPESPTWVYLSNDNYLNSSFYLCYYTDTMGFCFKCSNVVCNQAAKDQLNSLRFQ